ncbi:AcrR family transcriptional regulator [Saccharothrix coeruleofusca]|uniref:TetR/AcrR family transcriptional regulator n=1 Tax=Saccharothrix coeruleofusca TaxID=33919 RepID=UPI0027DDD9DC|nr:TetR/AcrR family transcriptional regulator C-terminal domain-containing protein [Saccharothrix coeruleofusca]MBP2337972.1 AcrR family transcriptional regulator [Saccharothrix coeruleofusca]
MRCAQCGAEIVRSARGRPRRYCGRACQARAYRARRDGTRRARPVERGPRVPLERPALVRAAVELADAEGLDAVSMRALAARVDAAATALYRHVSGKDDLVTAMVELVLAEYQPSPAAGWRALVEHEARQEWALYQRHPWVLGVLASTRPPLGRPVLAAVDRFLAALPDLPARTAMSVYLLVSGYVQGMAATAVGGAEAARESGVGDRQWWAAQRGKLAGALGSGWYPWLAELADDPVDLRAWFDFGLQRVLDGIGVFLSTGSPALGPTAQ